MLAPAAQRGQARRPFRLPWRQIAGAVACRRSEWPLTPGAARQENRIGMGMVSRYEALSRRSMPRADGADREGETRAAVLSAAALYVVGASLTGTAALLPEVGSATGVKLIAAAALVTAAALLVAVWRRHGGLRLAFAADLWGVLLVALLCASTGGAHSPFALIYFFAIGHAAAFQPRAHLVAVSCASLAGFLAPLAYEHVSTVFASGAAIGMVLALLTG